MRAAAAVGREGGAGSKEECWPKAQGRVGFLSAISWVCVAARLALTPLTNTAFLQLSQPTLSLFRGESAHGARLPLHRPLRTDFSAGQLTKGGVVGRVCRALGGSCRLES